MIEIFLSGILLGMAVAVPFGPVNILILNTALRSFKNALLVGFGAFCADMVLLIFISFGVLSFVDNEIFHKILAVFGFLFLSYMVFLMLKSKKKNLNSSISYKNNPFKSFSKGLFLNLTNPYVVGFWLSASGLSLQSENSFLLLCGLIAFILFWVFILAFFVSKFKSLIKEKHIFYVNIFSAIILEYFALSLLYKAFI